MDTAELVRRLKNRDEDGLTQVYDQYAPTLQGLILNIVGSNAIAEELLQQCFLKIWNNIHQYDESKSSLFTWMSRIARNTALDLRRLKSFENRLKTDSLDVNVHNTAYGMTETAKLDVVNLTAKLDQKYREILECIYLQGYTHSEASEKLVIPLGTVKTRLRIAIKQLREQLKSEKKLFVGFLMIIILILMLVT